MREDATCMLRNEQLRRQNHSQLRHNPLFRPNQSLSLVVGHGDYNGAGFKRMIHLTGSIGGESRRAAYADNPALGMLLAPTAWREPWCPHYATDNDVFANAGKPDWWQKTGETKWLKMLDRIPGDHPPLWCLLPDVVADWDTTIERAYKYRHEVEQRGFRPALALQNGCVFKDVADFAPYAVFIGGTTDWKWRNAAKIIATFKPRCWTHIGRVNGTTRIRAARKMGADSCDGTGLARFFDAVLPQVLRGLNEESPQMELFDDH